jgi:hypothetical protein
MTTDDLREAVERGDARRVTEALTALVANDALDDEAWVDALTLVEQALGSPAFRRARYDLGRALRAWMVGRGPAFFRSTLGELTLDVWRASDDFHTQYLCDFAGAALKHDPTDDGALDAFLEGTFIEGGVVDPYLHRGTDLDVVASTLTDGPRKASLLALHGVILECAGSSNAQSFVERAQRMDASLDLRALRARCARFAAGLAD